MFYMYQMLHALHTSDKACVCYTCHKDFQREDNLNLFLSLTKIINALHQVHTDDRN